MNKFTTFVILLIILLAIGVGYLAKKAGPTAEPGSLSQAVYDADHITGSTTAPVTLVEYSDFQCPACGAYYPILKTLEKDMGENFRFVYRHFPLRQIHKNAELAAFASEAAGAEGKFWEMHSMIFEHQDEWSGSTDARGIFMGYAKALGLNLDKFVENLASDSVKNRIETDVASGIASGVNGTPTFFINGKKITNPRSIDEFKAIISQAKNGS